jgi:hypothetical protein
MGIASEKTCWTGAVLGLGRVGMGYTYASTDGFRVPLQYSVRVQDGESEVLSPLCEESFTST